MNPHEAMRLLSSVAKSMKGPWFDIGASLRTEGMDSELERAWEAMDNPFDMMQVLRSMRVPHPVRMHDEVCAMIDRCSDNDIRAVKALAVTHIRHVVPALPSLASIVARARESVCNFIPKSYFPEHVLSSVVSDGIRNMLIELASTGGYDARWNQSLWSVRPGLDPLRRSWEHSTFDVQMLMLRLLRPPWWHEWVQCLATCSSEEELFQAMLHVQDNLPPVIELRRRSFVFEPFPDPRS